MPGIRSIYGDDIETGSGSPPEVQKRLPTGAGIVAEVWRDGDQRTGPESRYYLCRSKDGRSWVLWFSCREINDRCRIVRCCRPLTWCPVTGIDPRSAAAAMLESVWSGGDLIAADSRLEGSGLLTAAALEEIRDISLGIIIKSAEPFKEPEERTGKGNILRLQEAGPNHPIYKTGWVFGGTGLFKKG